MKDSRGFFLLEVLLAMAVLLAGIVLLFRVFSSCLRAASVSEARFQAALLVQGKMWEMEQWGQVGTDEPFSPVLDRPVRWKLNMEEPVDDKTPWRKWELQLDWSHGSILQSFALETYLPKK